MRDSRLRATMGRNGKTYVHGHYRWSTIVAKYDRLFTRLRGLTPAGREPARRR